MKLILCVDKNLNLSLAQPFDIEIIRRVFDLAQKRRLYVGKYTGKLLSADVFKNLLPRPKRIVLCEDPVQSAKRTDFCFISTRKTKRVIRMLKSKVRDLYLFRQSIAGNAKNRIKDPREYGYVIAESWDFKDSSNRNITLEHFVKTNIK